MKVCVPTENNQGLDSMAHSHFGSAPYYILHDTDTGKTESIQNEDQHHAHGACHPMRALDGREVNTVVVGGIGRRAVMGLNDMGIKVYRSIDGTVRQNVDGLVNGTLELLTVDNACTQHGGCEG